MKLSDKKSIQQIIATLASLGLQEVVICPGSRNAPFILSFSRHPAFHCTSIRDERSAGFFALGKVIESWKPVAIVCTSGSAALNIAPAIAEAYYQRLPLMVITADRPKAWTGQGDGQTINQTNIYQNHIRSFHEINGEASDEDSLWYISRSLCEGMAIANSINPGPVHFNVPLREPLYDVSDEIVVEPRIFSPAKIDRIPDDATISEFKKIFSESKKVMLLCGQHPGDISYAAAIKKMAGYENTIVLTESTSNIHALEYIENIDRCITTLDDRETAQFMPDLLITTGGAVVSKRIKALLRKYKPRHHWNIDPYDALVDTYQSLTRPVCSTPATFFEKLGLFSGEVHKGYKQKWIQRKERLEIWHQKYRKSVEYSDFFVFDKIYKQLPPGIHLHLSNSSPIRYAQLFNNSIVGNTWSNRGTSGIDGCTSTAVGAATAAPDKDFLLITGDIAFHYDINALWNETGVQNLKIILINNGGGGIFRIVSGTMVENEMSTYFETAQDRNAKSLAAAYEWDYLASRDSDSLENTLKQFFDPNRKRTILEIFTPSEINPKVLAQYWNYLKENESYND